MGLRFHKIRNNENRLVADLGYARSISRRSSPVCAVCRKEEFTEVTIEYGNVAYRKWGPLFTQMADERERVAHLQCLVSAGVFLEHLHIEHCALCGEQFYPNETVLKFETREEIGYAHWACVAEHTDFPVDVE